MALAITDWQGACVDDPLREVARLRSDNDSVAGVYTALCREIALDGSRDYAR